MVFQGRGGLEQRALGQWAEIDQLVNSLLLIFESSCVMLAFQLSNDLCSHCVIHRGP